MNLDYLGFHHGMKGERSAILCSPALYGSARYRVYVHVLQHDFQAYIKQYTYIFLLMCNNSE